jgi:putative glycosyltransferase
MRSATQYEKGMPMKLSIVASMYLSSPYLHEFCRRCRGAAQKVVGDDFEIILVNDDSPDDSMVIALELRKQDGNIIVIDLSRNFGHHKAMMTGLMYACGERVFLLDCDLEEPPEVLAEWWDRLDTNTDLDVIYGVQPSRKGGRFERMSGWLFYRMFNTLSPAKLPANVIVARLMTARYVRALTDHRDQEMYLFGLLTLTGFRQEAAKVVKQDKGSSAYTLLRRFSLFVNAITSFSNYPLYAIFYLGMSISMFAFIFILFLIINRFCYSGQSITGWTSLAVSIWAVGGLILTAVGVIGIYLAKIFSETKPRPYTIVRQLFGR